MTPAQYMIAVVELERQTPDRLLHASLGLSSEAGEVADLLKKEQTAGVPITNEKLLEELGDVLWYVALALKQAGLSMESAMACNIRKLRSRQAHGKLPELESVFFEEEVSRTRPQSARWMWNGGRKP